MALLWQYYKYYNYFAAFEMRNWVILSDSLRFLRQVLNRKGIASRKVNVTFAGISLTSSLRTVSLLRPNRKFYWIAIPTIGFQLQRK
jgi:hypothetical protein